MNSSTRPSASTDEAPRRVGVTLWTLIAVLAVALIVGIVVALRAATAEEPADAGQLVRDNSRVLSQAPDEQAVLVEFLDYECEACAAAYPFLEDLRAEYSETVTFVHRYYPLPGHPNSVTAAVAVEAAAQQGAYEPMYQRMFETQPEWSHQEQDQGAVFRGYAEDLGLDMAAYDAAVADPATLERVQLDVADGRALGVSGTPTFYLDGELLPLTSPEQFTAALERATTN